MALIWAIASIVGNPALAQSPKKEIILNPSPVLVNARAALLGGDAIAAIELLQRALREGVSDQQRPDVHNQLCVALNLVEDYESALAHCNHALMMKPYRWSYYNNRGNSQIGLGAYDKALADYRRGLELEPESDVLKRNIKLAQMHLDNRK